MDVGMPAKQYAVLIWLAESAFLANREPKIAAIGVVQMKITNNHRVRCDAGPFPSNAIIVANSIGIHTTKPT